MSETYTQADIDEAITSASQEARRQALADVRALAKAAQAAGYEQGRSGEPCGAICARFADAVCEMQRGHAVGPLDKHKAVFRNDDGTLCAVVWND
jgi:hypothetical protein